MAELRVRRFRTRNRDLEEPLLRTEAARPWPSGEVCLAHTLSSPPFPSVRAPRGSCSLSWCRSRCPAEAQEGPAVHGTSVRTPGGYVVLEVQHLHRACDPRGAETVEPRHPSERRRRHSLADGGPGQCSRHAGAEFTSCAPVRRPKSADRGHVSCMC